MIWHGEGMKADRVEVSWDEHKKQWLLRIQVGEEVIRRHCDSPKDVDKTTLEREVAKTAADEGYTVEPADIVVV